MNYFITYILPFILLVVGFGFLIKGASVFVDASANVAKKLGVSQLFIALTIVAMGTSIPETAVSLFAAIRGNPDLAVGNIVGTNTYNILFILGLTAFIAPLSVRKSTIRYEIPIMILTAILFPLLGLGYSFFSNHATLTGTFSRYDGIIFLIAFIWYVVYLACMAAESKKDDALMVIEKKISWFSLITVLIIGLALIIGGSSMTVGGATKIAQNFGVSERVIGLTIVAIGTSLPELATSIIAVLKKQDDLAIGNIVGSNIYNMLFIGGITSVITPVPYSASFQIDSYICIATSVLLMLCILFNRKRKLTRTSGGLLLFFYAAYLWYLLR